MKIRNMLTALILFLATHSVFSQDVDGCKDLAMFPTRMPNYLITECTNNFDAVEFWVSPDGSNSVTKEGTKSLVRYDFNIESKQPKPSILQILRNYESAAKKIGGVTMYFNTDAVTAVFKIMKNGNESAWVKIEAGGDGSNDFIIVIVLELEAMKQEITSNDMLTTLNTSGRVALHINFETGKAEIKTESLPIINQIVELLKSNPSLKISIEGHTDNVGTAAGNKTLSDNRATAVKLALVAKGIETARLSSKGFGQDKPVADNSTDEGKAQNRRVEIVKV